MRSLCFVTGGSGFVGRHLLPRLAARHRLRLLVRPGQTPTGAGPDHERIEGRLDDPAALARGVAGADVVVHLAALVSFRREDHAAMFAVNADATAALAAAARTAGVRRFLHCSTISAVAYRDRPEPVDERAPYNFAPLQIGYCDSKFAAEARVLAEVERGLDAVIVNPPSMYGAGDRRKGDGSLLTAVLRGELRFAPPGGINVAAVDDVCAGMLAALDRGRRGERYLLGGENLTGRELLERVARIVGGRAPRRIAPAFAVRAAAAALALKERLAGSRPPLTSEILRLAPRFLWCTSDKAARELGWRAGPVDAGIEAAWRELRDDGVDRGDSVPPLAPRGH
ncbi:MAG: NAD-dependent epimerase/dehydratase family protein [Planctomycetes bacterium]|nr:NAD-dependent epimerase/dehydratase family protein [Planctomycetota bacterium]